MHENANKKGQHCDGAVVVDDDDVHTAAAIVATVVCGANGDAGAGVGSGSHRAPLHYGTFSRVFVR